MSTAGGTSSASLPEIVSKKPKKKKKKRDKKDRKSGVKRVSAKKNVETPITQSPERSKSSLAPIESSNSAVTAATGNTAKPESTSASTSRGETSKKKQVVTKNKLAPVPDKSRASAASAPKAQTDATPKNGSNVILKNVEAFLGANWVRLQRVLTRAHGQVKYDAENQLQSICGKVVRTLVIQRIRAYTNLVSTCHKYRKKSKNVTLAEIKGCAQEFVRLAAECTVGGWNRVCISSFPSLSNHPRLSQLMQTTSVADHLSVREMHVALQACSALGLLLRHNSSVQAKKGRQTMLAHLTAMTPTLSRYKKYPQTGTIALGGQMGDVRMGVDYAYLITQLDGDRGAIGTAIRSKLRKMPKT